MDAIIKRKWLAALEGGEYEKCVGQLRSGCRFCALGVLCDVFDPEGWRSIYSAQDQESYKHGTNFGCSIPPPSLMEEVGVSQQHMANIMHLSDDNVSFAPAAAYIRANL